MKHLFITKLHPFTLVALIGLLFLLYPGRHVQAYTETFKAAGWQSLTQRNQEAARLAALDDALQKAVTLAVMAHWPETLTGPKAQLVMSNVLSRRNELIGSYRIVSEEAAQARYRVSVTADIRIDQLIVLLKPVSISEPPPTLSTDTKIVVFIQENQFEPGAPINPSKRVGAILGNQLKQAGLTVVIQNASPSSFAVTEVFMQTPLFTRQALALGRQQQADRVMMGIAKIGETTARLSATLFDIAKGEATATIQSDIPGADTEALRQELGTDGARQILEHLKPTPPPHDLWVDQGILVNVTTHSDLQKLVALRRAIKRLNSVGQVQPVEITTKNTTLSVLGAIDTKRLLKEMTRLSIVDSVEHANQDPGGHQIKVILSRY